MVPSLPPDVALDLSTQPPRAQSAGPNPLADVTGYPLPLAGRAGASGLDEAQVPRGDLGLDGQVQLGKSPAFPPALDQSPDRRIRRLRDAHAVTVETAQPPTR